MISENCEIILNNSSLNEILKVILASRNIYDNLKKFL